MRKNGKGGRSEIIVISCLDFRMNQFLIIFVVEKKIDRDKKVKGVLELCRVV